jgi:hypothetical protein
MSSSCQAPAKSFEFAIEAVDRSQTLHHSPDCRTAHASSAARSLTNQARLDLRKSKRSLSLSAPFGCKPSVAIASTYDSGTVADFDTEKAPHSY